jgi:AraC-like DNA-binding protein
MVSMRCIVLVRNELNSLGIRFTDLELGSVCLLENLSDTQRATLGARLLESGLELHLDKKSILVEKIKHVLLLWADGPHDTPIDSYSKHLTQTLKYEYNYLSNIFTEVEGITIQTFLINHRIEQIKELMAQGELNLSEIAYHLHYSSIAHLSNQFKKVTGVSPTFYKNLRKRPKSNL